MNKNLHKTIINRNTGLIVVVAENKMAVFSFSGSLKNNFDKEKVQNEIDLQVKVTKEFRSNVQHFQAEQNKRKDELKAKLEQGEISQADYDAQVKRIDRQNLVVNVVAGGLLAPSDSVLGVATSTLAPAASYQVGQYFKEQGKEGSFEHIATHAVLGALTSAANGGNALSGAVSAGGAEYIAQVTANTLFNKKAEDLTADEKQTVSSIAQLVGVVSGSVTGDSSLDAYVGNTVATNAVENNLLYPKYSWIGNYLTEKSADKETKITKAGDIMIENNKKLATTCILHRTCENVANRFGEWSDYYAELSVDLKQQGRTQEAEEALKLANLSQQYSDIARDNIPKSLAVVRNSGRTTLLNQYSENWNDGRYSALLNSTKTPDYYSGNIGANLGFVGFDVSYSWSAYDLSKRTWNFDVVGLTSSNSKKLGLNANFMAGEIMTDEHGQKLSVHDRFNKGKMKDLTEMVIDSGYSSTTLCGFGTCAGYSETRQYNGRIKSFEHGAGLGFKTDGKPKLDFSPDVDIKGTITDGKAKD